MIRGLYAIVDLPVRAPLSLQDFCEALVAGGAQTLQVRGKQLSDHDLGEAVRVVERCAGSARVVVNDRVEVARALGTWVHLGQGDWAAVGRSDLEIPFGLSTHDRAQVEQASRTRARYLGFGPIHETSTKLDAEPTVGLAGLRDAATATTLPLVAIGGITPERAEGCVRAGASAVASISGLLGSTPAEVTARAQAYSRAFG